MPSDICSVRRAGSQAVITLPAEVDIGTADQVGSELLRTLAEGPVTLIVDMTATVFCDSAGMRQLVRAHRLAAALNCIPAGDRLF